MMFKIATRIVNHMERVEKAADRAEFRVRNKTAFAISKDAKDSIITDDDASAVGSPPHTAGKSGHNLRTGIRYDSNKDDSVIGPLASYVGESGAAHELGEEFHGQDFEKRPFMVPSLERNITKFADNFKGSITE